MKKKLFASIILVLCILGIAWAGAVTMRPYGIATPYYYGYSSGAKTDYYLAFPTLAAHDTIVGVAATQTLTNKTLTAPAINGGTLASITQLTTAATTLTASADIGANVSHVELNNASVAIAATIAAPAAGRWLVITQIDAGTAGHTVTLTAGTYDGTNDVATFNLAGETLVLFGVSATRFVVVENIGSVGLS